MEIEYFEYYFNEFCIRGDDVYWYDAVFMAFLIFLTILIATLFKKSMIKIKSIMRKDVSTRDEESKPTYCILSLF